MQVYGSGLLDVLAFPGRFSLFMESSRFDKTVPGFCVKCSRFYRNFLGFWEKVLGFIQTLSVFVEKLSVL